MKQEIIFQRAEGISILVASILIYDHLEFSWVWFIVLLLSIDIFMLGYLLNNKIGAYVYNLGHSLIAPFLVITLGYFSDSTTVIAFGLIWLAHIGMDRMFGYGLKKASGFKHTHLGDIGTK